MGATKTAMRNVFLVISSLCYSVFSLPPIDHPSLHTPRVQLAQGLVTGLRSPQFRQDYFLGIPYAQPPLGKLRFAKPQPLKPRPSHTVDATKYGKACLQPLSTLNLTASDMSEDCLFINVLRPSNLPHGAKLPVMVWIYGGGNTFGASQLYNGSVIVKQSVFLNESVIYVSFNYRLMSFGFLAAPELAHASTTGTLNAGLHDMVGALKWVQENIAAFGGNKDLVTVFGESAGAVGIGSLLLAGGGRYVKQHNLFHGAVMESGSPSSISIPLVSDIFPWTNIFVAVAGCLPFNTSVISCLRSKPSEVLYQASLAALNTTDPALAFTGVVDGFFFKGGIRAAEAVRRGYVANVPIITGCNLDEGTLLVPHTFNNTDQMVNFFREWFYVGNLSVKQTKLFKGLLELYPDIPAIGSPYDPVGVSKNDRFFGPNNQFKRAASLFGDIVLHSGRRALLDAYLRRGAHYPAWTYLYTQVIPGVPVYLGAFHGVSFLFGMHTIYDWNPVLGTTSSYMISAWVAFANSLDPNRPYLPNWPKYGEQHHILQIGNGHFDVITDDFRKKGIEFFQRKDFTDAFNF
ncbi:Alpha/Beta hydrolase protein [Cantharellus anzutake]|uniref:Alpha/Beta hydrolase protein n=1 Tax=Cantharellus anzutake TaxID=1750568 RepID=UPI0019087958|nr:Alpha/Beta hydrolase protein [Cantharellus anzutake]KAF8331132.1 Alpha/Beta hydrolase protein [Cantharellus anzutake]